MIRTGIMHGSPEWHEARWRLLTASDVPYALGEGWAKTEDARAQQRAVLRTNKALRHESVEQLEHLAVAQCMEAGVLEYLRVQLGWRVERSQELCLDSLCPLLGATVDAVRTLDDGTEEDVEIKVTAAAAPEDCKEGGAAAFVLGCPAYHRLQNYAQLAVSGRARGQIVALHHADRHGLKVRVYENPRNEMLIQRIRETTVEFWEEVERLRSGEVA